MERLLVIGPPSQTRKILVNKLKKGGYEVSAENGLMDFCDLERAGFDLVIVNNEDIEQGPIKSCDDLVTVIDYTVATKVIIFSKVRFILSFKNLTYVAKEWGYRPLLDYIETLFGREI